jgi:hypothetical protein
MHTHGFVYTHTDLQVESTGPRVDQAGVGEARKAREVDVALLASVMARDVTRQHACVRVYEVRYT